MELLECWPDIEILMDDYPEGEDSEVRVVRLQHVLYSHKQVPHLWAAGTKAEEIKTALATTYKLTDFATA